MWWIFGKRENSTCMVLQGAEWASLNLRFSGLAETLDVVNFWEAREFKANPDSTNSVNSAQKKLGRSILLENSPNPCSCLKQRWGNIQGCTRPILRASYLDRKVFSLSRCILNRLASKKSYVKSHPIIMEISKMWTQKAVSPGQNCANSPFLLIRSFISL